MPNRSDFSPRLCDLKRLLLVSTITVMLAAPCLAESEWPAADTSQDQIQTVNPEDLQPQTFESPPSAEISEEIPAAAEVPPEVPLPVEPQPADETPTDAPAETTAPAETPTETPTFPSDAAIETPQENPVEAPTAAEIPAVTETAPEGIPPHFSENPIIDIPEDPPQPPPEQ